MARYGSESRLLSPSHLRHRHHSRQSHTLPHVAPVNFSSFDRPITVVFTRIWVLTAFHPVSTKRSIPALPPCLRYPAPTFYSLTALPYNSDFDGSMSLFACVPLAGDTLLHNSAIHALVHDRTGYTTSHCAALGDGKSRTFVRRGDPVARRHSVPRDFEIVNALVPVGSAQL